MARPPKNNIAVNINVNVNEAVASVARLTGALQETKAIAKTVGVEVSSSLGTQVKKNVSASSKYIQNLIGSLIDLKTVVKSVGLAMGVGFGVFAAGTILRNMYETFTTIEDGMHKIWTVTNLTTEGLKELENQLISLAKTSPLAMKDILSGAYYALSSGISVDDLMKFMEIAEKAAVAGYATMKDTVDLLTTIRNAYGYSVEYMGNVTDKLFAAMYVAKAEFSDFANNLGKVIPVASQLGISLDEILAGISALTQVGIRTDKASTYLAQFFNSIINPSKQAAQFAEQLGISLDAVTVSAMGLTGYLEYLRKAMKNAGYTTQTQMVAVLTKLIGEARASRAVIGMMTQDMTTYQKALETIKNSIGEADKAYDKAVDTLSTFAERAKKSLAIFAGSIVGTLDKVVNFFNTLKTEPPKAFDTISKEILENAQQLDDLEMRITNTILALENLGDTIAQKMEEYKGLISHYTTSLEEVDTALSLGDYDTKAKAIGTLKDAFKSMGITVEETAESIKDLNQILADSIDVQINMQKFQLIQLEETLKRHQETLQKATDTLNKMKQQEELLRKLPKIMEAFGTFEYSPLREKFELYVSQGKSEVQALKEISEEYLGYIYEIEDKLEAFKGDKALGGYYEILAGFVGQMKKVLSNLQNISRYVKGYEAPIFTNLLEIVNNLRNIIGEDTTKSLNSLTESIGDQEKEIRKLSLQVDVADSKYKLANDTLESEINLRKDLINLLDDSPEKRFAKYVEKMANRVKMSVDAILMHLQNMGINTNKVLDKSINHLYGLLAKTPEEITKMPEQYFTDLYDTMSTVFSGFEDIAKNVDKKNEKEFNKFKAFWNDVYSVIIDNLSKTKKEVIQALALPVDAVKQGAEPLYLMINLFDSLKKQATDIPKNFWDIIGGGEGRDETSKKTQEMREYVGTFKDYFQQYYSWYQQGSISLEQFANSLEKQQTTLLKNLDNIKMTNEGLRELATTYLQLYRIISDYGEQQLNMIQNNETLEEYLQRITEQTQKYRDFLTNFANRFPNLAKQLNIEGLLKQLDASKVEVLTESFDRYFDRLKDKLRNISKAENFDELIEKINDVNTELENAISELEKYPNIAKQFNLDEILAGFDEDKISLLQSAIDDYLNTIITKATKIEDTEKRLEELNKAMGQINELQIDLAGIIPIDKFGDLFDIAMNKLESERQEIYKEMGIEYKNLTEENKNWYQSIKEVGKSYYELKKKIQEATSPEEVRELINEFGNLRGQVSDLKLEFAGKPEYEGLKRLGNNIDKIINKLKIVATVRQSSQEAIQNFLQSFEPEIPEEELKAQYQELMSNTYDMLHYEYQLKLLLAKTDEDRAKIQQEYLNNLQQVYDKLGEIGEKAPSLTKNIKLDQLRIAIEMAKITNELEEQASLTENIVKDEKTLLDILKQRQEMMTTYQDIEKRFAELSSELKNITDIEDLEEMVPKFKELNSEANTLLQIAMELQDDEQIARIAELVELINKYVADITDNKIPKLKEIEKIFGSAKKFINLTKQFSHLFDNVFGLDLSSFINSFSDNMLTTLDELQKQVESGELSPEEAIKESAIQGIKAALPELEQAFRNLGTPFGDIMADGIRAVQWAQLGQEIGTLLGNPMACAIVGLLIGVVNWFINLFKSEWQKTYEGIRKELPDTIESALRSAKSPEELKERLKEAVFNATYEGLVNAFLQTSYMQAFMDNIATYMTDYLMGNLTAEQFKNLIEGELDDVNLDKLSEALATFYDAINDVTDTAKATEESLAYSAVRAITEQTANVMVSYLRDVRDTLIRIETITQGIRSNTSNLGRERIPYRGTTI